MKKKVLIIALVLIVLIGLGIFFIVNNKEEVELTDAQKFALEYKEVSEDNVFVYRNIDEIIQIMVEGSGIVYLGFPECEWCQAYVKYLDEVAKEMEIEEVYYFNIKEDREENTKEYQKIVKLLEERLQKDDEGEPRVFVPNVSFHAKGKLVGNNCETSLDTKGLKDPKEYWTKEEVKELKASLTKYINRVIPALTTCTECNEG